MGLTVLGCEGIYYIDLVHAKATQINRGGYGEALGDRYRRISVTMSKSKGKG